ncbi:MAG: hypothetical protein ACK5G7_02165 [Erysipelotrichaceae bacterium]
MGIAKFTESLTRGLLMFNQEQLLIALALFLVTILIFVFSLLSIPGILFFSNDIERVLPLPVKPFEIIIAKIIAATSTQYLISLFFLISIIIGYILCVPVDIFFIFKMIVALVLFPIVPALLASIFVILLVKFSGFLKNQDQYNIFIMICSFIFLAFYYIFIFNNGFEETQMIDLIIKGGNSLVTLLGTFLPHIAFLIEFIFQNNILSFLIFLIINLIVFALAILIAQKYYLAGALKVNNIASNKTKFSSK